MIQDEKAQEKILQQHILGTAGLSGVWNPVNHETSVATILKALDAGMMAIDTAPVYADTEMMAGRALRQWRGARTHISTKVGCLKSYASDEGIYALKLRYHDSVFYMVTTLMISKDENYNFYVTATNPAGTWLEPVIVKQADIYPSLLWDDDGKVYFQSNRAKSMDDPRAIYQSEIDIQTGKLLSAPKMLWKGSDAQYVEGTHVYKKDNYYYLMPAEGGTFYNHQKTIARSKNIWRPYESYSHNPILTARNSYNVIQGTVHGDLVQAQDGS